MQSCASHTLLLADLSLFHFHLFHFVFLYQSLQKFASVLFTYRGQIFKCKLVIFGKSRLFVAVAPGTVAHVKAKKVPDLATFRA